MNSIWRSAVGVLLWALPNNLWAAQEAVAEVIPRADLEPKVKMFLALAAGLGMAIAAFGGALGQGRAISAAVEGISRNPSASGKVFVPMIIGLTLIESLVALTFAIAFGLSSKI